jgi:hypothetical protein
VLFDVVPKMKSIIVTVFLLSTAVIARAAEGEPQRPAPAEVAKILGIDKNRVSADSKKQDPKLDGKVIWMATYLITGEQD